MSGIRTTWEYLSSWIERRTRLLRGQKKATTERAQNRKNHRFRLANLAEIAEKFIKASVSIFSKSRRLKLRRQIGEAAGPRTAVARS